VTGMIKVDYTIMCKNDHYQTVTLSELLLNEKIARAIKSEFATGLRNLTLTQKSDGELAIETQKEIHTLHVHKRDFADLLELAEEDAKKHKRFKKECDGVELVDITTIEEIK
jgi:antitoxin component of MazEF toxin-antitoxin module